MRRIVISSADDCVSSVMLGGVDLAKVARDVTVKINRPGVPNEVTISLLVDRVDAEVLAELGVTADDLQPTACPSAPVGAETAEGLAEEDLQALILGWLGTIDPAELQQAALAQTGDLGGGADSTGAAFLAALREWA